MLQTPARLLRLLSMLQARRSWQGAELSQRLEVTDRTLRRDIDRLRSLGYPVHSTSGVAGGYSLGAGASLPPLMLDNDEGVAVFIGLKQVSGGSIAGIEDAAMRALAKLERVLPARVRKTVQTLGANILRLSDSGPRVELEAVSTLAEACHDQVQIRFRYRDQHGQDSERLVEPQRVVHMERRWYLVAFDNLRDDYRTFRLDRLSLPIERGAAFSPRPFPGGDLTGYVTRALSTGPHAQHASLLLHAGFDEAKARLHPSLGTLEPVSETRCRLRMWSPSLEFTASWVGMVPLEFEIESPIELNAQLRMVAGRIARAADREAPT